jgi:hypothetical protein
LSNTNHQDLIESAEAAREKLIKQIAQSEKAIEQSRKLLAQIEKYLARIRKL